MGSGISRYALKQRLRTLRANVADELSVSFHELDVGFKCWLKREQATPGRTVPANRTEEIAAQITWLEDLRKRFAEGA